MLDAWRTNASYNSSWPCAPSIEVQDHGGDRASPNGAEYQGSATRSILFWSTWFALVRKCVGEEWRYPCSSCTRITALVVWCIGEFSGLSAVDSINFQAFKFAREAYWLRLYPSPPLQHRWYNWSGTEQSDVMKYSIFPCELRASERLDIINCRSARVEKRLIPAFYALW